MRGVTKTIRAAGCAVHTIELHNLTITAYDVKRLAGGLKANRSIKRLVLRRVPLGSDDRAFVQAWRVLGEAQG